MSCCIHPPNRHSADAGGCLECRCLWLPTPDGRATYNPRGRYARELWDTLVKDQAPQGWGPEIIEAHQVCLFVMCGGGHMGRFAAENPADFYIDDRIGQLPFSRQEIQTAAATLATIAKAHGLNPHDLPPMPLLHSFGIF